MLMKSYYAKHFSDVFDFVRQGNKQSGSLNNLGHLRKLHANQSGKNKKQKKKLTTDNIFLKYVARIYCAYARVLLRLSSSLGDIQFCFFHQEGEFQTTESELPVISGDILQVTRVKNSFNVPFNLQGRRRGKSFSNFSHNLLDNTRPSAAVHLSLKLNP